jgi:hypothetical protein
MEYNGRTTVSYGSGKMRREIERGCGISITYSPAQIFWGRVVPLFSAENDKLCNTVE